MLLSLAGLNTDGKTAECIVKNTRLKHFINTKHGENKSQLGMYSCMYNLQKQIIHTGVAIDRCYK